MEHHQLIYRYRRVNVGTTKIMIDRAIKCRCHAADRGTHGAPTVAPGPAGAGAAVYHATGRRSVTIAGNEPAPEPSEGPSLTPPSRPLREIAASRTAARSQDRRPTR